MSEGGRGEECVRQGRGGVCKKRERGSVQEGRGGECAKWGRGGVQDGGGGECEGEGESVQGAGCWKIFYN